MIVGSAPGSKHSQPDKHNKYEGLRPPRPELTTHASFTAPPTRDDFLRRRQPGSQPLSGGQRRASVAVGVWTAVAHLLDPHRGVARGHEEEELDMERLLFG
jgi:hypothetical protein